MKKKNTKRKLIKVKINNPNIITNEIFPSHQWKDSTKAIHDDDKKEGW